MVLTFPIYSAGWPRIVELAIRSRLPTMFAEKVYVESGGLISYSPNHADLAGRAGSLRRQNSEGH
jgi:hypothetical protein